MDQAWLAQLRRSCRSSILFFLLSYLELLMFIMLLFQIANHLYFYLEKNLLLLRGLEHHPSLEMLKCFFYYRIEDLYLWWQMCHVLLKFQFYSWLRWSWLVFVSCFWISWVCCERWSSWSSASTQSTRKNSTDWLSSSCQSWCLRFFRWPSSSSSQSRSLSQRRSGCCCSAFSWLYSSGTCNSRCCTAFISSCFCLFFHSSIDGLLFLKQLLLPLLSGF